MTVKDNMSQDQQINVGKEIKETIHAYWPLFVVSLLITLLVAFLYLRYTVPTYQAKAKVLVKDDSKTGFSGSAKSVVSQLDLFGTKSSVENEIEIIKSRPILREAIILSNAQVKIFSIGKILDVLQVDFPVSFIPLDKDSLNGSNLVILVNEGKLFIDNKEYPLQDSSIIDINLGSKFLVLINEQSIEKIVGKKYTLSTSTMENEVDLLSSSLNVTEQSKDATVIGINLIYQDYILAERILAAILQAYVETNVKEKRLIAQHTLKFIDDRLALVTQELDSVETQIENYKASNQIFDLSAQGEYFLKSVQGQDAEMNKISIQLGALNEAEQYLKGNKQNGTFPSLVGISDPLIGNMLIKLFDLEGLYNRRKVIVGEKDAELINLQMEVEKLKMGINTVIANARHNLESSKIPIEKEINTRLSELSELPSKERVLLEISRQQIIKNSIYTFLLQKREESAISYASTLSEIRIIEPARGFKTPTSPKRAAIWLAAILFGLIIPAAIIFLKERLNSKILFSSDIEKIVNYPVIGEIYQSNLLETDLIFVENSRSIIAESIRTVRTKLPFYFTKDDQKVLLVSSSVPGEGKSFFASNLGLSIALMGKKTVIVGGDMRKPKLHKTFSISNNIGLSTYLIGKCTLSEVLIDSGLENLYILPSGPIPPNPTELLMQEKWAELITKLKESFDFIVLDTPPLGLISEAEIMAEKADLSLFVIRHDYSPKEAVRRVLGSKDFQNRFPRTVIVFNGIKQRGVGQSGYGNSYSYGYGYSKELEDSETAELSFSRMGRWKKRIFHLFSKFFK